MKKIGSIFFFTLLVTNSCFGSIGDSLKQRLASIPLPEERYNKCIREVKKHQTHASLDVIKLILETLQEKELSKFPNQEIELTSILSASLKREGFKELAYFYFDIALKKAKRLKNQELIARIYLAEASAFMQNIDYFPSSIQLDSIKRNCELAENLIYEHSLTELEGDLMKILWTYHIYNGEAQKAQELVEEKFDLIKNDKFQASLLLASGRMKLIQGDFDSSLYYLNRCYNLAEEFNWNQAKARCEIQYCNLYLTKKDYAKALYHGNRADSISQLINWSLGHVGSLEIIFDIYLKQHNIEKTEEFRTKNVFAYFEWMKERREFDNFLSDFYHKQAQEYLHLSKSSSRKNEELNKSSSSLKSALYTCVIIIIILLSGCAYLYMKRNRSRIAESLHSDATDLIQKYEFDKSQKNQQISDIHSEIKEVQSLMYLLETNGSDPVLLTEASDKLKEINRRLLRAENWEDFLESFRTSYPAFENNLLQKFPNLTPNEMRIAIYVRTGLNSKEIAQMKNISLDGSRTSIKRLSKKLRVKSKQELQTLLFRF
ncbi:MAG: helix-turn-helix transcriptional regulator [Crocinitomicaceae bacterium]